MTTLSLSDWKSILTSVAAQAPCRWRIDATAGKATGVNPTTGETYEATRTAQGYWRVVITSLDGSSWHLAKLLAAQMGMAEMAVEKKSLRRAA